MPHQVKHKHHYLLVRPALLENPAPHQVQDQLQSCRTVLLETPVQAPHPLAAATRRMWMLIMGSARPVFPNTK
jgi:hypothetical protein